MIYYLCYDIIYNNNWYFIYLQTMLTIGAIMIMLRVVFWSFYNVLNTHIKLLMILQY
jgi:hypothetical protein